MPTKDGFDPAHPLPQFLTDRTGQDLSQFLTDRAEQDLPRFLTDPAEQDTGNPLDGAVPASRTFKAGILIATAAAAGIAVLALGDPVALLAWGTASPVDNSSPQSTPTIQSAAEVPAQIASTTDAQALPPAAKDAPARDEIAASEPAGNDQTEDREPLSEDVFRQFQAWAAARDAQARGEPAQPVQDAPAQVVQDVSAQDDPAPAAENVRVPKRLAQKRRHIRAVRNARAEMRTQNMRKPVRRAQSERVERPPTQDARVVDQYENNAQALQQAAQNPFLPIFGQRN
jgi:hypothetical protein